FVVVDSVARSASQGPVMLYMSGACLIAVLFVPFLRNMVANMAPKYLTQGAEQLGLSIGRIALTILAFALATVPVCAVPPVPTRAFEISGTVGIGLTIAALAASLALGHTLHFLNRTSLQQSLAQKLMRTFLGASNDRRVHPLGPTPPVPVQVSDDDDDLMLQDYHPEASGGPLHLPNGSINH